MDYILMQMALLQTCCFWRSVHKGSFASLIYTLFYFGLSCLTLSIFINDERKRTYEKIKKSQLGFIGNTPTTVVFNKVLLISSTFGLISSIIGIVGLRNEKRKLLLPWIIIMVCDILIEASHFIYLVCDQKLQFDVLTSVFFMMDFSILCLNVYCLLCVISRFQEYYDNCGNTLHSLETGNNVRFVSPTQICISSLHHSVPNLEFSGNSSCVGCSFQESMSTSSTKNNDHISNWNEYD